MNYYKELTNFSDHNLYEIQRNRFQVDWIVSLLGYEEAGDMSGVTVVSL